VGIARVFAKQAGFVARSSVCRGFINSMIFKGYIYFTSLASNLLYGGGGKYVVSGSSQFSRRSTL
jgi:hypothetical protein